MFTFDLAERLRGTGVSVHCVRVGNVAIPNERLAHLPKWMLRLYEVKRRFSMTREKMQEKKSWLPENPPEENQLGGYGERRGVKVRAIKKAYKKKTQELL